jgi:hypothetical protein
MITLKTNTAARIVVGPFLDATDGVTPETGITVTNCTAELYKIANDGGAVTRTALTLSASGGNNDMVHITDDVGGYYDLELTAANLNFLGNARLSIIDTDVHLPVFVDIQVLPANVWDSLYGGTTKLQVDVETIKTQAVTCAAGVTVPSSIASPTNITAASGVALAASQHVIVDSGTVTTLTNLPAATSDWLTAAAVKADAVTKIQNGLATPTNITGGTITTVTNLTNAPTNGDLTATMKTSVTTAATAATPTAAGLTAPNAAEKAVVDAIKVVTDKFAFTGAGPYEVKADVVDWKGSAAPAMTGDAYARLGAPAGASLSADVAAVKSDTGAILTDTGTTLDGNITAIKAKTDNLPASPAAVGSQMDLVNAPNATAVTAIQAGLATSAEVGALNDLSAVEAQSAAAAALTAYDPPTKAELDSAVSGLSTLTAQQVWEYATRTLSSFGALAADIWDKLTSGLTTVGSVGKLLVDNINAAISSRSSHSAADVWTSATRALTDKAGFTLHADYDAAKSAASQSSVNTIAGYLDTEIAAILAAVDTEVAAILLALTHIETAYELDGAVYRLTQNALEQAPSGSGATAQQVWEYATRALTDKAGFSLATAPPTKEQIRAEMDSNSTKLANLDGTITSRAPSSTALSTAVWSAEKAAFIDAAISSVAAGDATEAKQDTIITHLTDVKGTGFVKDTNSLTDLTPGSPIHVVAEQTNISTGG